MTLASIDGRKAYNLRPTARLRPALRTAHEPLKSSRISHRSATRQERSKTPGKRRAKLVQPEDDPLHEWPAFEILDDRLVERNGKSSKEYLIRWRPGPRGQEYEPTWEPCKNANRALRENYNSKTRKKIVGRSADAEKTSHMSDALQTTRLASDEAPDTSNTDRFEIARDTANAHPHGAVKESHVTVQHGPATGATENKQLHARANPVSSMISLLPNLSQAAPASQTLRAVGSIRARRTTSRNDALDAHTMNRGSIVESQIGRSPRPKGRLPSILPRYGKKAP